MQAQQTSIQNFISYIKNMNLHFENLLTPTQSDLKGITNKTFRLITDFQKFVSQYNQKVLAEIQAAKLTVPFIFYRSIKNKISQSNFMRYQYMEYEMKFVFIRINLQCHVHVEICKNTNGARKTCLAYRKLQNGFIYMMYKKLTQSQQQKSPLSVKFFKQNAEDYIREVYQVINGHILCTKCRKNMSYHNQLKTLLPPTVRLEVNTQRKQGENYKPPTIKYIHQSCI